MRKNILSIFLISMFFSSCWNYQSKNIIDIRNIDKKIHKGMIKDSILVKFGVPMDSLAATRIFKDEYYYFVYETNDFSGYFLTIWFNEDNEVVYYRVD